VLDDVTQKESERFWTRPVTVAAVIANGQAKVDCRTRSAADACYVRVHARPASNARLTGESAPFPILFDATRPLAAPASLTFLDAEMRGLTPAGRLLRDAEMVRVYGRDYPLRAKTVVKQCTTGEGPRECAGLAESDSGDSGTLQITIPGFVKYGGSTAVTIPLRRSPATWSGPASSSPRSSHDAWTSPRPPRLQPCGVASKS
jgi:hypothetical protein